VKCAAGARQGSITEVGDHVRWQEGDARSGKVAVVARRTRYRHGQTRQLVSGVLVGLAAVIAKQIAEDQAVSMVRCGATRVDPTTTGLGMFSSSVIMSPPYSDPLWRSGWIPQPDNRLILVGCVMTNCCAVKPRGDYKRNYRLEIEGGFIHRAIESAEIGY